ncbi:MAG TPA: hypothetical protein VFW39_08580 [Sphingomicrobium sp.]|nr:hypothetical protein [Sphingomicrobium sp.]
MHMRPIALPLLLCATPALAQVAPPPPPPVQPPLMIDPGMVDRVTDGMQALSHAMLDMRVGGLRAALEGREATPAEKRLTVRDLARRQDPDFERRLDQQIAAARPKLERGMRAMNEAFPEVTEDLQRAERAIDRAGANMPDPNYPRR